jgi:16S rRNA (guanine966-N2)-methyltransferase
MRIVAGTAGGRIIATPEGEAVRPTSERVREAIFNSLFSHGLIDGANVLDLFAGSGALGLEALSRGAERVTFVDFNRQSADLVRANIELLGFGDRATVRQGDALDFLGRGGDFDLVLLDPPYAFDQWEQLIGAVTAPSIVVESARSIDLAAPWRILKEKRYASTVVTIAVRDIPEQKGEDSSDQEASRP